MAIIKSLPLTSDVNITYWNIEKVEHIKDKETLTFRIRGYSSEQAREDDVNSYFYAEAITVPHKSVADIQGNLYEVAYEALKEYNPELPEKFKVLVSPEVLAVEGVEGVEAVEGKEAVLDEEGNIIEPAVEPVEGVEPVEAVEYQPAVYKSWFEDAEASL